MATGSAAGGRDSPATRAVETRQRGVDACIGAAASLLVFGVYLATLYPGLVAVGDAAKFAFVGKVLGTPHAPGYPLYIMVSHVFSLIPWGTLAYRMNLLSALLASVTVAFAYLILRRMGAGRAAAVSTALALGLGSSFWSRALYAKGYTLNAALVAAGVLALLRWDRTRRSSDLYLAAAIFAVSLGNHLTVLAILPAIVLFVLVTDYRAALRPATVAIVVLLVLLGLSQYFLILIRTVQGAPYLEARATNLQELWAVMTARRFAHEIGAFPLATVFTTRAATVGGLVASELGVLGVPLLGVGLAVLVSRRSRFAFLLGLGALGVAGLTANMSSNEDQGFLLPVFVLLWPIAGMGLDLVLEWLRRVVRTAPAVAVVCAASVLPCSLAVANYAANDRHADTFEMRYFDALFAALPSRTAIVSDEYTINMMVLYKLLGEQAAGARDIRLLPLDRDSIAQAHDLGFEVFAFSYARAQLMESGFNFMPGDLVATGADRTVLQQRALYRLASVPTCFDIGNQGWVDLSRAARPKGRLSVRIDNSRPFDSQVVIYTDADELARPMLIGGSGAGSPTLVTEIFRPEDPAGKAHLAAQVATDHVPLPNALTSARFVARAEVKVNDRGAFSTFALDFGATSTAAVGRALVDLNNPKRATICSHPLADIDAWPADAPRVSFAADSGSVQFGGGWYSVERRPDGSTMRWTAARASLVIPIGRPRAATVTLSVQPLDYPGRRAGTIVLDVNGHKGETRALPSGAALLAWDVPEEQWRSGLNVVTIDVGGAARPSDVGLSADRRLLGVSVTGISLSVPGRAPR